MTEPFPPGCAARYHHVKLLAQGGFGSVHLARQVRLDREVAIKLLHSDELADPGTVARFLDEARVTASLSHPGIVRLIDHDVEDGTPWIAYEYLPGRSLDKVLREGALPWRTVALVGAQVAEGLAEAHAHGVLHRDVKPANIMEAGPSTWKLTDFGVARWTRVARMLTNTGDVVGTMGYIAPELLAGAEPAPAADVFALGVTLHELLFGHHPYGGNIMRLLQMQAADRKWIPAPSSTLQVPAAFDAALVKAVAADPARRFASAGELAQALRGSLAARSRAPATTGGHARDASASGPPATDPPSAPVRPWMLAFAFTLIGVGLGAAGTWALRARPAPVAAPAVAATPRATSPAALSAADKAAIRAALVADVSGFEHYRARGDAIGALLMKSMAESARAIEAESEAILKSELEASPPLVALEPRLPEAVGPQEIEPESADLAERLEKAVLWHQVRIARYRQLARTCRQFVDAREDNFTANSDFGYQLSVHGHLRNCLEPARRWLQRTRTHLAQVGAGTSDESARALTEDLDHFARYLGPRHWHREVRTEWERFAAPLVAALPEKGDAVRTAFGAFWAARVEAGWADRPMPPARRAELEASIAVLARLAPGWRTTLALMSLSLTR